MEYLDFGDLNDYINLLINISKNTNGIVEIKKGEITNIDLLKHECGLGKPAEEMIPTMIQKNDVEVDAITNATYSSEVIKDAIRNALRNGKRQD